MTVQVSICDWVDGTKAYKNIVQLSNCDWVGFGKTQIICTTVQYSCRLRLAASYTTYTFRPSLDGSPESSRLHEFSLNFATFWVPPPSSKGHGSNFMPLIQ